MKKNHKWLSFLPLCLLVLGSCGSKPTPYTPLPYTKESEKMLSFSSSDKKLDFFLNDYFKRHAGYVDAEGNDWKVTSVKAGVNAKEFFWQEWSTMMYDYFDSEEGLESNRLEGIRNRQRTIPVDRYGFVWGYDDSTKPLNQNVSENSQHSMGWPFPTSNDSEGFAQSWDFNQIDEKWTSNVNAVQSQGLYIGNTDEAGLSSVDFVSPLLDKDHTIFTWHAPFLELDLRMYSVDAPNIDDVYVYFKNTESEDWSEDKKVSFHDIAAIDYAFEPYYEHIIYLPMFASPSWDSKDNKEICQLKISIQAKEGKKLTGRFGLNYVRSSYDTRHTNNICKFINALRNDYALTGDLAYLQEELTRARRGMNFLLSMYDETRHLNDQSYLIGHDGDKNFVNDSDRLSHSLTNGYWDVLFMSRFDFQTNMYFYKALKSLAYLETVAEENHLSIDKKEATTLTASPDVTKSYGTREYQETPTSLSSRANDVLEALRAETNDTEKTGFFNAKKGRFIEGFDAQGNEMDWGYTMWNLEAITEGIATPSQAKSIMAWINGDRVIAEDETGSQGEDIYHFSFAPRATTTNKKGAFNGSYRVDPAYGQKQVQYGGAIMYTSYYDLLARMQVLGKENAFSRLEAIEKWYQKIYDYFDANRDTVTPQNFYWDYYRNVENITIQSGIHSAEGGGSGLLGLDGEFLESLLLISAIPFGFFGLKAEGNTLSFTPNLPSSLDYWKMENLLFHNVRYDCTMLPHGLEIDSVRGNASGLKLEVRIAKPRGNYTVYINGTATKDYREDADSTVVSTNLQSATILAL